MRKFYKIDTGFYFAGSSLFFFKSFLQRTHAEGKTVILIIDEVHRLPLESLEEIRLLSNMEQDGKKLINIFLAGQNEFKQTLFSPECHALRQRITLFYNIHPLSEDETRDYVVHRLKVARFSGLLWRRS